MRNVAVAAGAQDVALAIGAEQTFVPSNADRETRKKSFNRFMAGTDVEVTTRLIERMQANAEQKRQALEREGEGGPYAASGATTLGGTLAIHPSAGLECRGYPIGATGLAQDDAPTRIAALLEQQAEPPDHHRVEYSKNEEASHAKIRNGWLHTGDLVHADEAGNLYFVDRLTDSLRRRGENISSWELERELNSHPSVLESAVFGVPSELGEDDGMAVIVLEAGEPLAPEERIRHVQGRRARFRVPRSLRFRDSIPKTETHRVQKNALEREGVGAEPWDPEAHRH